MKKFLSLLLVFGFIPVILSSASANEQPIESVDIIETRNGSYIDVDLNINDETVNNSVFGLQKASVLPSSYSSVDHGYVTPVKNQGSAASCWAFATMSSLESDVLINSDDSSIESTDFSPYHLAWFTYMAAKDSEDRNYGENYTVSINSPYSVGGNWKRATSTLANFRGIANNSSVPENQVLNESLRYLTDSGYVLKDALILETQDEVKNWIMDHGGCYFSYYQDNRYLNTSNGAYYNNSGTSQNHAITVVGWDDNYSKDNFTISPSSDGAWLCKNSFGTSYTPLGGYMWISYEDVSLDMSKSFFGFSAQKNVYSHNYSYNNVSYLSYFPFKNGEATAANVFTAADDEIITAVAFHTVNKVLTAKIKIYTDIPQNSSSPQKGNLGTEYTISLTNSGYHTVKLPDAVIIEKGKRFSVVITLTGNGTIGLPVEKNNAGSADFTGNPGESFMLLNGSWRDSYFYAEGEYRNFYISALSENISNHNIVTDEKPATCTETGYKKVYCSDCDLLISYEKYAKSQHNFAKEITPPTCTESGFTTYTCSCGYTYENDFTAATGHEFERTQVISENIRQTVYETKCRHCDEKSTETETRNFWQRIVYFFTHLFNW